MRWEGYVEQTGKEQNRFKLLVQGPVGTQILERPSRR